jgi:hypothetical protein
MHKKQKNMMIALIMTITLLIVVSWSINSSPPRITAESPDFYGTSKEVSLDEMIGIANMYDLSIHLPSEMPSNLKMTAIYLKESPFIAIIVFSAEGNKDYITAELTIEITSVDPEWIPTYSELQSEAETSPDKTAMEINTWPVMIYENADIGGHYEARDKYGDYTLLLNLWIDEMGYLISAPTLNVNDAVSIVESMALLNAK